MKKFFKEKGFTGQDIMIATFSVMVFLSLITSLMLNLTKTSIEIQRMQNVTKYLSIAADNIDAMDYSASEFEDEKTDIDILDSSPILNNIDSNSKVNFTYSVGITQDGEAEVKTITIKGKYDNSDIGAEIKVSKRSDKRLIGAPTTPSEPTPTTPTTPSPTPTTPSEPPEHSTATVLKDTTGGQWAFKKPTLNELYFTQTTSFSRQTFQSTATIKVNYTQSNTLLPIKFQWTQIDENTKKGKWVKVTDPNDLEWYSIEERILPTYTSATQSQINSTTYNPFKSSTAYVWIPKISDNEKLFIRYNENSFTSSRGNSRTTAPNPETKLTNKTKLTGRMIKYADQYKWYISIVEGSVTQDGMVTDNYYQSMKAREITGNELLNNTYMTQEEQDTLSKYNIHTNNQ